MAKLRFSGSVRLKVVAATLQMSRFLSPKNWAFYSSEKFENFNITTNVPADVKEGYFGVCIVDDDGSKRFVVPISVLSQPWFLKLLDQAAEEYGFNRMGALTVSCSPSELERVLLLHEQY